MEEKNSNRGKILLAILAFIGVGLIVGVIIFLVNKTIESEKYEPRIDQYSGNEIWNIDEDPELEPGLNMIGFYQILDRGFMKAQYQKIVDAIEDYMVSNHPDAKMVSYWSDTFESGATENLYRFKFVADDGKVYRVNLDTMLTLDDVLVEITAE